MEKTSIELRKVRDIGLVINISFSFIAQEYKLFFKTLSILVLPVYLILKIITIFIEYQIYGSLVNENNWIVAFSKGEWKGFLVVMIINLLTGSLLVATVYGYVKQYHLKGHGNFAVNDVAIEVRAWFWRICGSNIAIFFLIVIGFILLVVPGIYIAIPLSFITAVMVFEDCTLSMAFSRCFALLKGNWWQVFLLLLVIAIIIFAISFACSIPFIIFGFTKALHNVRDLNQNQSGSDINVVNHIADTVRLLIIYIANIIIYLAYSFQYFSMVEKKERPSLAQKIDDII
jgi:hypothetical protein